MQVSFKSAGHVLARRLPEMRLLRLPAGGSWIDPLHPRQSHALPKGLFKVMNLFGSVATDTSG